MTMIRAQQVSDFGERIPIYLNTHYVRFFTPHAIPRTLSHGSDPGTLCQMDHASAVIIDMPFEDVVKAVEAAP